MLCAVRSGRLHVLVVKSADGKPVLPYTWIREGASLDEGARELSRDIAGPSVAWMTAGPASASRRHPAESALSVPYVGVVSSAAPTPVDAVWCPVDALPALAPRHKALAEGALATLRLHMDASPVAFRLLPHAFTLSELQQAYELLLGRRLHKASFRRALQAAYLVEPTEEWRSEGRGRPAQLFKYAPRKRRGGHRSVRFDLIGS
ncbi:MAG: NUDIX hydrolase [Gemmatimonadaceae bacterium]